MPNAQCQAPANRCLAFVTLRGSEDVLVRDVTDIDHAGTISNYGPKAARPKFVTATWVSYEESSYLRVAPLGGGPDVLIAPFGDVDFDWSPDGDSGAFVFYMSDSFGRTGGELHLVRRQVVGENHQVGMPAIMPGPPVVWGCESQECADRIAFHLAYSPDGHFISWGQNLNPAFRLWTSAGVDVTPTSLATDIPFMLVWSGANLYFRDSKGVEVLHNGAVSPFLPGVAWIRPKASPAGRQMVYEARDASGLAHVYVVSTISGFAREIAKGRAEPGYLTARYVWYRGERLCTAADRCATGPVVLTGKTYLYDLQTGVEYPSIITNVYDAWPHAA
jgi:hypothetical protein